MPTIITPNMSLVVPIPGVEPGPQYANDLNASLTLIDQHNHTPGFGVQIPPDGLDINADLTFQSNNATDLRSIRFTSQSAPLSIVTDISNLYAVTDTGSNGDLWFNDASGNQIQITKSSGVNATISSLVSGVNEASFIANQLVVLSNNTNNTPGNIKVGSVLLGNNIPSSNFLTLQPPNAMAASYSLTLPSVPAGTSLLQIDNTGNITPTTGGTTPSGGVIMYGGAAAPSGYLLCDGTSYLRSLYPDLFTAIGTAYGTADGTHFNVPDMRGLFPRGVTGASANDPDASSRTANNLGGNAGNNVGSQQTDDFLSHNHTIPNQLISNVAPTTNFPNAGTSGKFNSITTDLTGGTETRPKNVYFNFIIKI